MKRRKLRTALCVMLVGTVLAAFVAIAAEAGSQGDPLVTLSYLNDTFLGQLLGKVDTKIAERDKTLQQELEQRIDQAEQEILSQVNGQGTTTTGTATSYREVTLSAGQVLNGSAGCEVMLRVGTASCVSPSNPGLIDETTAASLNNGGALAANHLYMMTIEGRGVKAGSDTTKLLVRGSYTIA